MAGESLYALKNRTTHFSQKRSWVSNGVQYSDVHKGDDYAETYGNDAVYALTGGTVTYNGYSSIFGWQVWVGTSEYRVRYHMLNAQSPLKVGDVVRPFATLIGYTGASAANATGNHLHIQVEPLSTAAGVSPVDPRPHIDRALAGGSSAGGSVVVSSSEDGERMVLLKVKGKAPVYLVGPGKARHIKAKGTADAFAKTYGVNGKVYEVSSGVFSDFLTVNGLRGQRAAVEKLAAGSGGGAIGKW